MGKDFVNKILITNTERINERIEKWKETDVQAAFFFKDIKFEEQGNGIFLLHLEKPFWVEEIELLRKVEEKRRSGKFHPICKFYKEYCKEIIRSIAGKENVELNYLCENGCLKDRCALKVRLLD